LEIASAEKDRFLANLSHELRTPLVSILGYSAMLLDTPPDSENFKKMVSTINKSAKHQVQLIEDLLDLSRIISGKIELKKDFFNVAELAGDSVDTIRNLAAQKGLEIEESYENCRFYGDRKRLSQVFLNLLSNAVKFTEKGKICLTFRCTKDYLTIKITDTGIGIDPNKFHLLFQPFKQLDSSSTRAKTGLGLGLSIVKNIVDLHNGKVTVESKVGEGSEFTVFLPVLQAGIIDEADSIHKTPTSVVTFEGVKMLLVEDDPDSAEFVKYLYEQRKAKVDWADSAKGARELIEKNKYDLYLFDLSMPLEDGISLIKSVRAKGDKTKAVALTAFADTFYEKTALDSGFDMFLKKPSSLLEMLSVIKLIR
jgi:CheY-like chemotaxis protein/anti-sigma regulatory factor (Ser/Thr protein kinase)